MTRGKERQYAKFARESTSDLNERMARHAKTGKILRWVEFAELSALAIAAFPGGIPFPISAAIVAPPYIATKMAEAYQNNKALEIARYIQECDLQGGNKDLAKVVIDAKTARRQIFRRTLLDHNAVGGSLLTLGTGLGVGAGILLGETVDGILNTFIDVIFSTNFQLPPVDPIFHALVFGSIGFGYAWAPAMLLGYLPAFLREMRVHVFPRSNEQLKFSREQAENARRQQRQQRI